MSADTATAEIRPFTFDTDFDALADAKEQMDRRVEEAKDEPEEEEEFEEEIVPTFSEEELENAKKQAFDEGLEKGKAEAMATVERETRDVIKALSHHITELFSAQEKANNVLLRDGIGISTAMVRKMFPEMNRQNALTEISRLIETTLMRLIEEPRIIIRTHPDMQASLDDVLPELKAGAGYEGRVLLKEDAKLNYGDCRLEWGDGSAERMCDQLWQSIDQIIEDNLGGDTERAQSSDTDVAVETGVTRDEQSDASVEVPTAEPKTEAETAASDDKTS